MTFLLSLNKKLANNRYFFSLLRKVVLLCVAAAEDAMHAAKFRQQKPDPYPQLSREKLRQQAK
jgi:hypothetical protein